MADSTETSDGRALICVHGGTAHPKTDECFKPEIPEGKHQFSLQRHFAAPYLNAGYTSPQWCGRCNEAINHAGWQMEPCYGMP